MIASGQTAQMDPQFTLPAPVLTPGRPRLPTKHWNWCHFLIGVVSTSGPADTLGPSQVRIKASLPPGRYTQPWVCCDSRLRPWKHPSPGALLGVLLPMFPEGKTGWGKTTRRGSTCYSPFCKATPEQSLGDPDPTLIGQPLFLFNLFPLQTQLRPARSF